MKRKIRCAVCGAKYAPEIYQVKETVGSFAALSTGTKTYDACDCPECGKQKLLGERYERIKEKEPQQDEIVVDIDEGEEADDE